MLPSLPFVEDLVEKTKDDIHQEVLIVNSFRIRDNYTLYPIVVGINTPLL